MSATPRGRRALGAAIVASLLAGGVGWVGLPKGPGVGDPMAGPAAAFLDALEPARRDQASIALDDSDRKDWHFIPRDRRGAKLRDMTDAERVAAHGLLRSGLSSRGYLKAVQITSLESVLQQLESADPDSRDPGRYWCSVFGQPGEEAGWGWRFEGHHVSLNFTSVGGETAVTPMFLGSNPAEVRRGPSAGLSVLAEEAQLGRGLLDSLDPDQRAAAVLDDLAPADILLQPGRPFDHLGAPAGLRYADMRAEQRAIVEQLIAVWTGNLTPTLAGEQLARIRDAGLEDLRFCWLGEVEPGRPHYYRLQGPTFAFEFDNTQNDANHIHTVWRDAERDFGEDLLRRHLADNHDH